MDNVTEMIARPSAKKKKQEIQHDSFDEWKWLKQIYVVVAVNN